MAQPILLEGRTGDLIKDTARRMGVGEKALFRLIVERKGFTNEDEVADYRYVRWLKHGEIPPFVEEFCLNRWRTVAT